MGFLEPCPCVPVLICTYGTKTFLFMADFTFSRWILFLKPNRLFQLLSLTVQAKTELSPARYLLALWRKDLPDTYGD